MQVRLQTKLVVLITFVAIGVGLISSLVAGRLLQKECASQLRQQAEVVTQALSESIAHNLEAGDAVRLRGALKDVVERIDVVDFAFVTGADGKAIAHSFDGEICPETGQRPEELESDDSMTLKRCRGKDGPILVYECAIPPGNGATLCIAMDESRAFGQIQVVCNTILGVSLAVAMLGAVVGFFLSRRAIKPLGRLAWAMRSFGTGAREQKLDVVTSGMEAEELARAFNRMIDNRKRIEEELATAQAMLLAAIEQTPAGILIADAPDVRIRIANSAALGIRGDSKTPLTDIPFELHPRNWLTFHTDGTPFKPEDLPLSQAILYGRTSKNVNVIIRRPNGENRYVLANAAPVRNARGEIIAGVVVFPDVTDIRRQSEERKRLGKQMQEAQKLESLGVLAGGIAHDFNNLLVGILGNADLALMDTPAEAPARDLVEDIKKAAVRASELAGQMLAYSGKGRFVVKPFDLNAIVQEMAHLIEAAISKKVEVRFELAADLANVEGDVAQIRQIIMNIIINASEAIGKESGTIVIRTSNVAFPHGRPDDTFFPDRIPGGDYVCLAVRDNGCGMDGETRRKMFDPFFSTKFAGRGLGLAALHGIVRGHRGTVQVASEPGKGTEFKVFLPRSPKAVESEVVLEAAADLEAWRSKATVLVVDDEAPVRDVARSMLQRHGIEVMTARHGREGIETFKRLAGDIDLVLLDMTMPESDGEEVFREIRQVRKDVKVILWSGFDGREVTQRLAAKGLAAFIQKPFDRRGLIGKVRCVLEAQVNP